jgi:hypothetical protein
MLFQLALALLAQDPPPKPTAPAPLFVDDTAALPGVTTTCGSRAKNYIIEVDGGGLALADFDGDGDLDLVVVDGSTLERVKQGEQGFPTRLFLNDGSGHFAAANDKWTMRSWRWGMGCAVGDVNSDGWLDLVVTQWGRPQLFVNLDGKGLSEMSNEESGFTGARWCSSAAFLDYDRDGCLDLALINYLAFDPATIAPPGAGCTWKGHDVMCGPEGLVPVHDQLYRGSKGITFTDATANAGFKPAEAAFGLGVTTLDYDLDGDTDIYVSNDSTPNFLWENQGDGTFKEVGMLRGVSHDMNGKEQAGMGIACGDVNGDGREDLFVTNFSGENNAFYQSKGDRGFRERSAPAGLAGPSIPLLGWGTSLQDFDLDGDLDVSVMNGHVYPQADLPGTDTSYAQPAQLYRNDGAGNFTVESLAGGPNRVMRASTCGDIDGDGDLDLVAIELDGPVRVFRNTTLPRKDGPHWLRVQLRSKTGNRFALGARVVATWSGGKRAAEVRTSGGFQSSVPPEVHFGLGSAAVVSQLSIHWPSGREQKLADVAADRVLVVDEPER